MRKIYPTFLLIYSLINFTGHASVIPADELFQYSKIYSFKLNPTSKYVAKHYFRGEDYNVIEILDVENNFSSDAFRLKVLKYAYIQEYYWVDENTLYIRYRAGRDKYKRIFLDVNFEKINGSGEEIASIRQIKSTAQIIDNLQGKDDTVLVQLREDEELTVFEATTEELISNNLSESKKFRKHLDSALNYYSGENGKIQLALTFDNEKLNYWYLKNYQSSWIKLFQSGEFDYAFEPIQILKNNMMMVITNKDTDKKVLQEFNYVTKSFGEVHYQHDKYDLDDADVSADTGDIQSVSYYKNGTLISEYFTAQEKSISELINRKFPGKQYSIISRQKSDSKLIIIAHAPDDPGEFYWVDSKTKTFKALGSRYPNLKKYSLSKTKSFSVKSASDINIEAILTIPNKPNGVLIVSPHGGPVGIRDNNVFNRSNQYYASRGYSILNVNFRGSHGYGKKFLTDGIGQFGKKIEEDISLVVKKVKADANYHKTCASGASYGGYSSFMLAAYHPDEYDCVVGAYGIYDLPLLFNTSNIRMMEENIKSIERTVGEYNENLRFYSPLYIAQKINSPVFLIAGVEDPISGFEQSHRMNYRLKQLDKQVETLFYKDTGHGHSNLFWQKHEHIAIDEFIRRHLNLATPEKEDHVQLRKELVVLADRYEFNDKVDIDHDKAVDFYLQAAEAGEPRALSNMANFYKVGDRIEKDIDQAIEFYRKSSELEYSIASYRLASLYLNDQYGRKDLKESKKYFNIAMKQDHQDAEYQLSRFDCFGLLEERRLESCYSYMNKLIENDDGKVMELFYDLFFDENLTELEIKPLITLAKLAGLDNFKKDTRLKVEDYGSYKKRWPNRVIHDDTETQLTIDRDNFIGATVRFENDKKSDSDIIMYKVRWHHPDLSSKEKTEPQRITNLLKRSEFNREIHIVHAYKEEHTRKPGEWTLEIESLSGELLYRKKFFITFEAEHS